LSGGKPGVPSGAAPLGWKPALPDLETTVEFGPDRLEGHSIRFSAFNRNQLGVGKARLPPLMESNYHPALHNSNPVVK